MCLPVKVLDLLITTIYFDTFVLHYLNDAKFGFRPNFSLVTCSSWDWILISISYQC